MLLRLNYDMFWMHHIWKNDRTVLKQCGKCPYRGCHRRRQHSTESAHKNGGSTHARALPIICNKNIARRLAGRLRLHTNTRARNMRARARSRALRILRARVFWFEIIFCVRVCSNVHTLCHCVWVLVCACVCVFGLFGWWQNNNILDLYGYVAQVKCARAHSARRPPPPRTHARVCARVSTTAERRCRIVCVCVCIRSAYLSACFVIGIGLMKNGIWTLRRKNNAVTECRKLKHLSGRSAGTHRSQTILVCINSGAATCLWVCCVCAGVWRRVSVTLNVRGRAK